MSKSKASQEETNRRIEEIRAFHDLGRKALQLSSSMSRAAQAIKLDCKQGLLDVARRFAVRYPQAQLDTLCAQMAKHRPTIGTSHVGILIAVPLTKRFKLQTQCIKKNWSVRQLKRAKAKLFQSKSWGGRHPQVTASNAPVLFAEHANSFCRLVKRMKKSLPGKPCVLDDISPEMRASIKAGLRVMMQLQNVAQAILGTTQEAV